MPSSLKTQPSNVEFIALMALLMSLLALSIDTILPALSEIGSTLGVGPDNPNDNQLLLSTVFLGMALGLMIYGPLSDAYGRKKIIYLGISIFILGSLVSLFSTNFTFMLIGRGIQGFGAASCRVLTIAMIRDKFEGREMAKIMSLISTIFIVVPALAPSIGQGILFFSNWKAIFIFMLFVSIISIFWLHIRQPETLPKTSRQVLSFSIVANAIKETVKNPVSRGFTIASGLIFGSFIGYLSSAQQIFQELYGLAEEFSFIFGCLALALGMSSYINSRLLKTFTMNRLCLFSLSMLSTVSVTFYLYIQNLKAAPPILAFLAFLTFVFLNFGLLFGNFNALTLKPLGHIAGTASSVISSIQILLSVLIGSLVGLSYNDSIGPLIIGFMLSSIGALIITIYLNSFYEND